MLSVFDPYLRVAEMLDKMFHPLIEIIIHDLTNPEAAIIAIYNGSITGRKKGDPTTDIGIKRVLGLIEEDSINYRNRSPKGNLMKSSSIAIKDEQGKIVGAFSVNLDLSLFENFQSVLNILLTFGKNQSIDIEEEFTALDSSEEVKFEIQGIISDLNFRQAILSKRDKKLIVREALKRNVFQKKKSVKTVAEELQLTRPTLYKYLKEIKNE